MNSKQAKATPLHEFLGLLGYRPAQVRGNDIWYRSPFRPDERTPSFKIDRAKNVWFDHGIGEGGTIIDFVQHLNQTSDIARVLSTIADVLGSPARPAIVLPEAPARPKDPPVIESVQAIADRRLEAYLASRGIPLDLARVYLKEVAYRAGGNTYRSLAFGNDSGGFEVRSPEFKGSLGHKDITYLAKAGSQDVAVFEGFFDFLSVLAHYKRESSQANVLVMNSVSLMDRAIERLGTENTRKIYGYLDHDEAGENGLKTLRDGGQWEMVDASGLYLGHKDANAFILAREG